MSTPQMTDRICMTLDGRISEEIFFGSENITSDAQDDLQKILGWHANFGMNEVIGREKTAEMLDSEVRKMITIAYQRTKELLTEHREDVIKVAELLTEKENITREDMIRLRAANRVQRRTPESASVPSSVWPPPTWATVTISYERSPPNKEPTPESLAINEA
ncbi:hypothetical protein C8R47DRAFT_1271375 [Mycena vitilis]|nr:hypothetical protein C8R47DRAFT_1271375 [Mycena vitilis]